AAAAVLLDYLPYAPDEAIARDARTTLTALAVRDGKPDAALLAALKDALPAKRRAAGEALVRAGAADALPDVRKLPADPEPQVRLALALVLVEHKEKPAVPVLIDLLDKLPPSDADRVEDVLFRLAGAGAPPFRLGSDTSPAKVRERWQAWWAKHQANVDLA